MFTLFSSIVFAERHVLFKEEMNYSLKSDLVEWSLYSVLCIETHLMHCVFLPIVVTMCQRKLGCSLYVHNCMQIQNEWFLYIKRTEWLVDSPALSLQIKGSKDCFSDEIHKGSNGLSYFCVNGGKHNTTKYTKQLLKITQIRSFSKK